MNRSGICFHIIMCGLIEYIRDDSVIEFVTWHCSNHEKIYKHISDIYLGIYIVYVLIYYICNIYKYKTTYVHNYLAEIFLSNLSKFWSVFTIKIVFVSKILLFLIENKS